MKSTRNTARFSVKSKKNGNPASVCGVAFFVKLYNSLPFISGNMCAAPNVGIKGDKYNDVRID